MHQRLPIGLAAAGLAIVLAGCTTPEPTTTPGSGASVTSAPRAEGYVFPEVDGECVDGIATITDESSNAVVTVGDCEVVVVAASNSRIILGAVRSLAINSSISLIEVGSVESVVFAGQGNRVVTTSGPVVEGDVENNVIGPDSPEGLAVE